MITEFYQGSYAPGIGYPYVIISIEESTPTNYSVEVFILYRAYNGQILNKGFIDEVECFEDGSPELIKIVLTEAKNFIYEEILEKYFPEQLSRLLNPFEISLNKTDKTMLAFLHRKYNAQLTLLSKWTSNKDLLKMIDKHKMMKVAFEELEFDNPNFPVKS